MKKHYLIYQITNIVNNKIYIGKHITGNVDDDYFGSGTILAKAKQKYGLDKFVKTILFELQNEEEMNLLERCVVTKEFCNRKDTYNACIGGEGGAWSYLNQCPDKINYGKNSIKRHLAIIKGHQHRNKEEVKLKWKNTFEAKRQNEKEFLALRKRISETTKQWYQQHPNATAGEKNSQYGTMWICNDKTHESKKIHKDDIIPFGWRKGRFRGWKNKTES